MLPDLIERVSAISEPAKSMFNSSYPKMCMTDTFSILLDSETHPEVDPYPIQLDTTTNLITIDTYMIGTFLFTITNLKPISNAEVI